MIRGNGWRWRRWCYCSPSGQSTIAAGGSAVDDLVGRAASLSFVGGGQAGSPPFDGLRRSLVTEILDWCRVGKPRAAARVLGSSLRQGAVVAFPTESSYLVVASALVEDAVARVQGLVGPQPLQILLADPSAARDWLPRLGGAGQRVTRRMWPGPLTLVSREGVR